MRRQLIRFIDFPALGLWSQVRRGFWPQVRQVFWPLPYYIPGMERPEVKTDKNRVLALINRRFAEYQLSACDADRFDRLIYLIKTAPEKIYISDNHKILGVKPSSLCDNKKRSINNRDMHRVFGNIVRQWIYLSPATIIIGYAASPELVIIVTTSTIINALTIMSDSSSGLEGGIDEINSLFDKYEAANIENITCKTTNK